MILVPFLSTDYISDRSNGTPKNLLGDIIDEIMPQNAIKNI